MRRVERLILTYLNIDLIVPIRTRGYYIGYMCNCVGMFFKNSVDFEVILGMHSPDFPENVNKLSP